MDIYVMLSIIGWILGPITTYVIAKTMINRDRILDIFEDILGETTQNEEVQKKVFLLGVIVGNGIKQGMGMTKKGGKFSIEALIGEGIGQMIGSMFTGKEDKSEKERNPLAF